MKQLGRGVQTQTTDVSTRVLNSCGAHGAPGVSFDLWREEEKADPGAADGAGMKVSQLFRDLQHQLQEGEA